MKKPLPIALPTRTSTVEIRNVGTTQREVAEAVRKKLGL